MLSRKLFVFICNENKEAVSTQNPKSVLSNRRKVIKYMEKTQNLMENVQ